MAEVSAMDDGRLTATAEAVSAMQRAADAARRNALKLTAALEREAASSRTKSRTALEGRVGAANAAVQALEHRLDALKRQHARQLAKPPSASTLKPSAPEEDEDEPDVLEGAASASLLMAPIHAPRADGGRSLPPSHSWAPIVRPPLPAPGAPASVLGPGVPRRLGRSRSSSSLLPLRPLGGAAGAAGKGGGRLAPSGKAAAPSDGDAILDHSYGCVCLHCRRRAQLLTWRDSMAEAQRATAEARRGAERAEAERAAAEMAAKEEAAKEEAERQRAEEATYEVGAPAGPAARGDAAPAPSGTLGVLERALIDAATK
jgi:hypothetical protein